MDFKENDYADFIGRTIREVFQEDEITIRIIFTDNTTAIIGTCREYEYDDYDVPYLEMEINF